MTAFIEQLTQTIQITPVTGGIGAEVAGVKLHSTLDSAIVEQLHQALLTHKVLFFKGQEHLDDQEQEKFAALWGEPVRHPTVPSTDGTEYIFELDSQKGARANSWHTDVTFIDAYPKISILRGVVIPEVGGDTTWANTEAAYDDLPESLKQFVEQLTAVHSNEYDYAVNRKHIAPELLKKFRETFVSTKYETEHPVVVVHPETGKKSLLLGHFFKRLVGFNQADSQAIFNILQDKVLKPENIVRWKWQAGDVVIWDNRSTQHYAVNDYADQRRIVRRVTLAGEVSQGVNGQRGKIIVPENLNAQQISEAKNQAILNSN